MLDLRTLDFLVDRAQVLRTAPDSVTSPCISVCQMSVVNGLCEGCLRTIAEVAGWSEMGDEEKRAVWSAIEQRALSARSEWVP